MPAAGWVCPPGRVGAFLWGIGGSRVEKCVLPDLAELGEADPELPVELDRVTAGQTKEGQLHVVAPRQDLELRRQPRARAHNEPALRFAEEGRVEPHALIRPQPPAVNAPPPQPATLRHP